MRGIVRHVAGTGLIALVVVGGARPAEAQWFNGAGYFAAGVSGTATGELDDLLASRGYPRFGPGAGSVSLGAYMVVADRLLLGAEWTGIIKGGQEHQGRTISLGGGYGTLGVGYAFHVSPRLRVYPRFGLGAGGLGLTFDSTEPSVGFDDVLADPDGQAELTRPFEASLSRGHAVVDLGAGAEFMPSRTGRGLLVGARLGFTVASSPGDWQFRHRPVTGGPAAAITGPYIKMLIGAGGWR